MTATDDMVVFLMPDGTKVSNDPRFGLEEALQRQLDATEYRGDAGVHPEDQTAQTQVDRPATLNSAQPGVGENDRPDDIEDDMYGPLGSPAQQRQAEDAQKAADAGASPHETSVTDPEPVDSNEQVLQARARRQKRRDELMEAMEEEGEEPGNPDEPYSEWRAKQLKLEILRRNADRDEADQIVLERGARKDDAVQALEADDAARTTE
jgi:hypothetical protein